MVLQHLVLLNSMLQCPQEQIGLRQLLSIVLLEHIELRQPFYGGNR